MVSFDYADLSRMTGMPRCAVIVRTREEAEAFYYNLKQQFSDRTYRDLEDVVDLWEENGHVVGFTLIDACRTTPSSASWCDEPWFRREGYEIIEFSSLVNSVDIEEGDKPIDFLFSKGGEP